MATRGGSATKFPPQPRAKDNYPWHLNNRNKRGLAVDLKSPQALEILQRLVKWADVLIVNTPHPARKRLKLEYEDVTAWNPRLIYARRDRLRRQRPRRQPAGLRHHVVLGAQRFALVDARCRRAAHAASFGERRSRHGCRPFRGDRDGPVPARAHGARIVRHNFAARNGRLGLRRCDSRCALRREILPAARPQESAECDN